MNGFDFAILGVILISAGVGVIRGFIRETLSLVAWLLALWLAFVYAEVGAKYFVSYVSSPALQVAASFGAIFVVALLLLTVAAYLIHRALRLEALVGVDRLLGAIFGVVRALIIIAGFMLLARLTTFPQESWWVQSKLAGHFTPVVALLQDLLPPDIARHLTGGGTGS